MPHKDKAKRNELHRKYREKNPEKFKGYQKKYSQSAKGKESARWSRMKYATGLSKQDWTSMFEQQGGQCKICCCKLDPIPSPAVHVDHCHSSGKIRGLLCHNCNHLLGTAKDSIVILRSAISYLEQSTHD